MPVLTIGRVGLEVDLDHPAEWRHSRTADSNEVTLRGFLKSTTATNTDYLRTELYNQQGQLIAVTYTLDSLLDGFYVLTDVAFETIPVTYRGAHFYVYELTMVRIGSESSTELQSLLTVGDILNDFGTTAEPWHATPVGALAYSAGAGNPTEVTRTSADGDIATYVGIDPDEDPVWAVSPANYYKGAASLYTQDMLRSGLELYANDPTDWYVSNGLVQIRPRTYQGASNGQFELRWYDGTQWDSWIAFKVRYDDTNDIPQWHYMTVVRNHPELVIVRLVRDAATVPAGSIRHSLDIGLRRGSYYGQFLYSFYDARNNAVARVSSEAATRPSTASSYMYATAATDGNRWVMGMPYLFNADTTNGKMTLVTASTVTPFWIGASIGGSMSTGNTGWTSGVNLTKQYTGWTAETVRAVRR